MHTAICTVSGRRKPDSRTVMGPVPQRTGLFIFQTSFSCAIINELNVKGQKKEKRRVRHGKVYEKLEFSRPHDHGGKR